MAGTPVPDSKLPAMIAFGFVGVGILIYLVAGTVFGGVIAALGVIPACVGMWKGIQQQTQTTLALSIGALLAALGVGGLLIILRIVHAVADHAK